jgi:predicted ferric reductase
MVSVLAAQVTTKLWWYVARASGLVSWALVIASVLWGLALAGRFTKKIPPPAWTLDLHRFLGGLAVSFVGVHVAALVADTYVHFGWSELFVPLASKWRPWPVAFGIVALYLLLAVEVTSLLMRHLPRRLWRFVHLGSFLLAFLGTVHGLTAGADAQQPIVRWAVVITSAILAGMVTIRLLLPMARQRRRAASFRHRPSTV